MRSSGCLPLAVAAVLALCLPPPRTALAGPPEEAEKLIRAGIELRKAGKNFDAYDCLRKAFDLHASARAAAQLGLVEFALSRWSDAESHLEWAIAAPNDPWIGKNRDPLMASLAAVRAHIGELDLTGQPAGASVFVNGRLVGVLPLPRPVRVGEGYVELELRAPGHRDAHRTVTVAAGRVQPLYVQLEGQGSARDPVAAAPLAPAPRPLDPPRALEAGASRRAPLPAERPGDSGAVLKMAGVAAGGGLYMSIRVSDLQNQYDGEKDPAAMRQLRDDGHVAERWQFIGYGVGAAALVAGGVLYYLGHRAGEERGRSPRVVVAPVLEGGGVGGGLGLQLIVRR
jgi:hypothetical protein